MSHNHNKPKPKYTRKRDTRRTASNLQPESHHPSKKYQQNGNIPTESFTDSSLSSGLQMSEQTKYQQKNLETSTKTNYSQNWHISSVSHAPAKKNFSTVGKDAGKRSDGNSFWVDESLTEWPEHDYRLFIGNIGPEVKTSTLEGVFSKYPSYAMSKVVVNNKTGESKGYGFVSFLEYKDSVDAFREWNGKYIGFRPCLIRKSTWQKKDPKKKKKNILKFFPLLAQQRKLQSQKSTQTAQSSKD